MKEAKGGLAEFLDDTIQLSTIVLLILLEADTKFERSTQLHQVPLGAFQYFPRCSVDIAQLYPEQTE